MGVGRHFAIGGDSRGMGGVRIDAASTRLVAPYRSWRATFGRFAPE